MNQPACEFNKHDLWDIIVFISKDNTCVNEMIKCSNAFIERLLIVYESSKV